MADVIDNFMDMKQSKYDNVDVKANLHVVYTSFNGTSNSWQKGFTFGRFTQVEATSEQVISLQLFLLIQRIVGY